MAADGINWDTGEWNRALVEYAAASRKDWPTICDDKARDLAIKTIKRLPKAVAQEINWVQFEAFWPLFISWKMNDKFGKSNSVRWTPEGGSEEFSGQTWDHEDALRMSDSILAGRRSSVGFMKGGFGKAARAMGKNSGPSGRRHDMSHGNAILATVARPLTSFRVQYDTKKGSADAAAKLAMAYGAIRNAMILVQRDMMKYVERKMRERGRAISVPF